MSGPACPRLTFEHQQATGGYTGLQVTARADGREVGSIFGRVERDGDPFVAWIEVDPGRCRQGIATQLYTQLAKLVCKQFGRPLHSDTERTAATQRFWEKQVSRGRAVCVGPGEPSGGPAILRPDMAATGRGGCLAYRLTECNPSSLAGRRRPKPRQKWPRRRRR